MESVKQVETYLINAIYTSLATTMPIIESLKCFLCIRLIIDNKSQAFIKSEEHLQMQNHDFQNLKQIEI